MRLHNSHATKARLQSESNYQKTVETEQLTRYQMHIRIRTEVSKDTLNQTTHKLSKPDENQNQNEILETKELTPYQARSWSEPNYQTE